MRKKLVHLMVLTMVLTGIAFQLSNAKAGAVQTVPRSTWLWNTKLIETTPDSIIAFLEQKGVKQVYLQVDQSMNADSYKNFIEKAGLKNIEVHALDGAPDWATSAGAAKEDAFLNWVQSYQIQAAPSQKFTGIHLDVEPYLYSGWNTNYKNTVLAYQTALLKAKNRARQLGILFGADMPFWFDEKTFSNKYGKGSLASWIIENADIPAIMAYRDTASGSNGIIALVKNEVKMAASMGKTIAIGVETGQTGEGSQVTFYEEGEAFMNNELEQVRSAYSTSPSLIFAIHHVQSWMEMKP